MATDSFDSVYDLPVFQWREAILNAVDANQVTIITAETGAGKSTQVPQYLAEHGYHKIIVTQPRILAARNLCRRVRQEYSWRQQTDETSLVGYRTAHERDDDPANVILYCTDGLQLVRELTGSGIRDKQVLILDEIHEWNENMEVLIAWAKRRCQEDPHFKVVLMSATIESDSLARYFNAPPAIAIPGRTFAVEKRHSQDLVQEVINQMDTRHGNMLVFLPGKAEIEAVAEAIAFAAKDIPIIPLHSQLSIEAQQQAFAQYPQGKVVLATNVAQTSITIDDIDTVIDSGLERRAEVRSGVEGLFIEEISQADCLQRAGRAGRTKEGLYVLARLNRLPCSPLEQRPEYGVPEIMRKHIDRLVLRLAAIGLDIEALEFYHAPSHKTISQAKHTLVSLGALHEDGVTITAIGQKMERFPVESKYARMLVEAERCSPTVQAQVASIIAIQEVGGIVKGSTRYSGWQRYTHQHRSDLIAQYDVYRALASIDPLEFETLGIIEKNATKAQEVNERLNHDLGLTDTALLPIAEDAIDNILQCIVAGQLHQIWLVDPDGSVTHISTKQQRELSSSTVVRGAGIIVGTPFDLQVPTEKGSLETLHLVNEATAVDPRWLETLMPDTFTIRHGKKYFDERSGLLLTRMLITYRNRTFETTGMIIVDHTPENQKLFVQLFGAWLHEQLEHERQALARHNPHLPHVPIRQIQDRIRYLAPGAISIAMLPRKQQVQLLKLKHLETFLGERFMRSLKRPSDQHDRHHHRRHRGWQPRHKRRDDPNHHRRHEKMF